MAVVLLALAIAAGAAACSTTYQPRQNGRVGIVIHHGAALYVKDGRTVPIGPLGGDLENLVVGTPAAAAHAHRARNQLAVGVPAYVGGLAAVVTGLALAGPAGWIVLGVGAASAGTGLCLIGAGLTNGIDAVNLHNDAVPTATATATAIQTPAPPDASAVSMAHRPRPHAR